MNVPISTPVENIQFGDMIRCHVNCACLHTGLGYKVYRTLANRLYICCSGPHYETPGDEKTRHIRHYLDSFLDQSGTHYSGLEKLN